MENIKDESDSAGKMIVERVSLSAKIELLEFLAGIAQRSQGAEVWRSLFSEIRQGLLDKLKRLTERQGILLP